MQFTVLIEFLIPGLATTLLTLALLPANAVPHGVPAGLPAGETAAGLLLLMVSYPVGILTNFAIFVPLQQRLLTPLIRRRILAQHVTQGIDLWSAAGLMVQGQLITGQRATDRAALRRLFALMRTAVFSRNIERLNSNHLYHEGLQRLARGMLIPLLLACAWITQSPTANLSLVAILMLLFLLSLWLLHHSVSTEEEQVTRFFLVSLAVADAPQAHFQLSTEAPSIGESPGATRLETLKDGQPR